MHHVDHFGHVLVGVRRLFGQQVGAVRADLEAKGIVVRAQSTRLLAEEAPFAYKDVSEVMDVVHEVGLARKVARLKPLGVLKG